MEGKKISFGFMKTKKTEKPTIEENKEYIECVEEKSIRIVGGETVKDAAPLIIPMKPNTLITAERLKQIAEEVEGAVSEQPEPGGETKLDTDVNPGENETLEQMALRELVQDAKKQTKTEVQSLTVPVLVQPILDGHKESTMEDYESVPIQQFGLAMLRGMGWTPGNEKIKYKEPQLRPKGLGLGADKVVKDNQKKNDVSKDKDEEVSIVKNAFVKITSGKYGGYYGKVVSLDEDNGRVMVDISVKKETVSLSEFMMQPVTKNEFDKQSRVINADTYEEYKRSEQMSSKSSKLSNNDKDTKKVSEQERSHEQKKLESNRNSRRDDFSNGKNREKYRVNRSSSEEMSYRDKRKDKRRDRSSSDERTHRVREKPRKKYSSDESSSDSESHKRKHKKNRRKSASPDLKRDIDKKRKGKKKKRDRDRSPNYKKHRK